MDRNWTIIEIVIKQWMTEIRPYIIQSFDRTLQVDTKENFNDLVTEVDKEVEIFLTRKIMELYPNDSIVGEEGMNNLQKHEYTWYIDPIDGTMNFVHQQENFCISMAIYKEKQGKIGIIYDVTNDVFYSCIKGEDVYRNGIRLAPFKEVSLNQAIIGMNSSWLIPNNKVDYVKMVNVVKNVRGVRSYGSACIELAYVAMRKLDAYLSLNLSPWDYAAGKIMIEELGGLAININKEELNIGSNKSTVLIGNKEICLEIADLILEKS